MEFLKSLFGDKALTFEQLSEAVKAAKLNVVDLSKGGYVSQAKFDDKVNTLQTQVTDLTAQIGQRDTDIATLQANLEEAKTDAGKLSDVSKSLTALQAKYDKEKAESEGKLKQQRYEFAVREKANALQFTSTAAKKAFLQEAIAKNFQMDGDTVLGFDDYVAKCKADDPGAFIAEKPADPNQQINNPAIVLPNPNEGPKPTEFQFAFAGVRPHNTDNQT